MRDPFRFPQPLTLADGFRIIIIGSGFAGLGMAIALRRAGFDNFVLLEKNATVGGTWQCNSYPGAACDVKSHLYSYSFELNPRWTRTFAPQREILEYVHHCINKYDLRRSIQLNTEVTHAQFDEPQGLWTLTSKDGTKHTANVVISACGGLSRPLLPNIAGRDTFQGASFHTARWDGDYDMAGKSVAVIGTGASAIQVIPAIAPQVKQLTIYQRTPPWIVERDERAISAAARARYARWPALQRVIRTAIYWQLESTAIAFTLAPRLMKLLGKLARKYIRKSISDPELRAKVTPNYTIGCKRILLSNDYYPALQRANVELVNEGAASLEADGIRSASGQLRQHDCVIFATGFQCSDEVAPFPIYGRDRRLLSEEWVQGAEAFKGTTVNGFPNLFMLVGPNTGLGHSSMIFMIESQVRYTMSALQLMAQRSLRFMDVRAEAQTNFNDALQRRLKRTVWASGCKSWYRAKNGRNTTLWPGFTWEFALRTRDLDPSNYQLEGGSTS